MSVSAWTQVFSVANVTTYRAWGTSQRGAFLALGLIQTADTGQINWTTAALGAATVNTAWGYEIYRFDDPLQATVPVFIKVEYGRGGSTSTDVPAMWITVGRATNGAGTLSSLWAPRQVAMGTGATAYGSATPQTCWGGSDGSGFVMALHTSYSPGSSPYAESFILVERSRNEDGTPNGDALAVSVAAYSGRNTTISGATSVDGVSQQAQNTVLGFIYSTVNGLTLVAGAQANIAGPSLDALTPTLAPIVLTCPGIHPWNSKLIMWTNPGDGIYASTVPLERYGQPHTYRLFTAVYPTGYPVAPLLSGVNGMSSLPAILWDA